ncbi:hypothetical protein RirG_159210 [Rhizophagus irregularis DAOM 197198w]|uniref:Uncharacterized protein n=1 Tax=Rhizophagus irregularis (strain DAOM 197198w) TaxID=1432141 RepID=A0A015M7B0_RHIIW|nr:hypothetical protein RirG_159210 [Rhizophagus irregularis DAOM 197198w]
MFKDLPYTDEYNHQIPVKFLRPSSDDTLANIQPNASSNNNTSNISIETPLVFTEVATAYYTSSGEVRSARYRVKILIVNKEEKNQNSIYLTKILIRLWILKQM